ncbi:MAG: tetratricopeptide repeat protein [Cytophagaceae bacterium]|nr:tetratricopeptide repeat protein [Cytophagaceae bacterium]MDW8455681.1 tetratricopeptide repeat protein [Cytophagaceae bacterium]
MKNLLHTFCASTLLLLCSCSGEKTNTRFPDIHNKPDTKVQLSYLNDELLKYPENDELYYKRATLYFNMGYLREAKEDITTALEKNQHAPEYSLLHAQVLYAMSEYPKALQAVEKSLQLGENTVEAYLLAAQIHFALNDTLQTRKYITLAQNLTDNHAAIYYLLGCIRLMAKDTSAALTLLRKSSLMDKRMPAPLIELAHIYARQKKYDSAMFYIIKTKELRYPNAKTEYTLGTILENNKMYESAEYCYWQAIKYDTNFYEPMLKIAQLKMAQQKYPEAEKWLKQYVRKNTNDPVAYRALANICSLSGKDTAAIPYYEKLTKLDSTDRTSQIALQRLYRLKQIQPATTIQITHNEVK